MKKQKKTYKQIVRSLRISLREIKNSFSAHEDEYGNEIDQEHDCFCARCIAVRALFLK